MRKILITTVHSRIPALLSVIFAISLHFQSYSQTTVLYENFDATPNGGTSCGNTNSAPSGWTQDTGDNIDWSAHSGSTSSSYTGPTSDHTGNSGKYMYTEASSCYSKTAILISPSMDLSSYNSVSLKFWYHMYGSGMGVLYVDISTNNGSSWTNIWSKSGNQGANWLLTTIYLNGYKTNNVKIRFRGITGSSYTSDMAIDDILVSGYVPNDLALEEITNPQNGDSPSAAMDFKIKIKNNGTSAQHGFTVKYSIDNGNNYVSETVNDTLSPGTSMIYTFNAKANMAISKIYNCVALVHLPGDNVSSNDTISNDIYVCNPLSGIYTIGTSGDFQSLGNAMEALSVCGISGPVTFMLDSGIYDGYVTLPQVQGASASNTISITGRGINTIFTNSNADYDHPYIFDLNGAKHYIIDSITITKHSNVTYFTGIHLWHQADSNIIRNCVINCGTGSSSYGIIASGNLHSYYQSGNNANYNLIENNIINGGYSGVSFAGINTYTFCNNNIFINNTFINQRKFGLYFIYQESPQIKENNILSGANSIPDNYSSIYMQYCQNNVVITKNHIKQNGNIAVYLYRFNNYSSSNDTTLIANNIIVMRPESSYSVYGITTYYSKRINIFHNSISINSEQNNTGSNCLKLSYGSTGINITNNIFANFCNGYTIYSYVSNSSFTNDYNDLYTTGQYLTYLSTNQSTLSSWQQSSAGGLHSLSTDPSFISNDDLHTNNILLSGKGIPLASVNTDIDGETRSVTAPDIGADEFVPPAHNLKFISVNSNINSDCNFPSTVQIYVKIANFGTSTETSFPVSYIIDNNTPHTETFSGTLNSLDTIIYTFSSVALPNSGYHILKTYTSLATDTFKNNDTISTPYKAYLSITSFPFIENFETDTTIYFHNINNSNSICIIDTNAGYNSRTAAYMTGNSSNGWNYTGSDFEQVKQSNSTHYACLTTCDMDLSNVSGLKMSFNFKVKNSGSIYNNWFFVTVNDTIMIRGISGDSIWHNTNGNFINETFNLSQFAGDTITIQLNGYLKYNKFTNSDYDEVTIDDIRIWEPLSNDVGITDIFTTSRSLCGSANDSIYVKIKNYGTSTQTNIPVTLTGLIGSTTYNFTDTLPGPLAEDQTASLYMGIVNTTDNSYVNFNSYTTLGSDADHSNDTNNVSGYLEVYKTIPFTGSFESSSSWTLKDFMFLPPQVTSLPQNILYIEYPNDNTTHQQPSSNYSTSNNAYAVYNKNIGIISQSSYLRFYFIIDFTSSNMYFTDSINFYFIPECSGTQQLVYSINQTNYTTNNNLKNILIPINNFNGKKVQLVIEQICSNSSSAYRFGIYDLSILNSIPVSLGNDTTLCYGQSVVLNSGLNSSDGYSFLWTGPGVGSSDTLSTLTAAATGTYTIAVTDSMGLISYDTVNVTVLPKPTGYISAQDSTICYGDSTTGYFHLSGSFPIAYQWTDGNTTRTDTALTALQSTYFSPQTTTQFQLISVTDSLGCQFSPGSIVQINVNNLPTVSLAGLNPAYCSGDASVTAILSPTGGILSGTGIISGNIFDPATAGAGTHLITYSYTDQNNCTNSDTSTVTVYANPVVAIVSPVDTLYCDNEAAVQLFGYPSAGNFSGSGVSGNIFNPSAAAHGADTIVYQYTDSHSCSNSDTVITTTVAAPQVNITSVLNTSYCSGDADISLTATPTGGTFTGNGVSGNIFSPAAAPSGITTIIYSYSDANGCVNKDTVTTVVNTSPAVYFTTPSGQSLCKDGTTLSLTAMPSGGNFGGIGVYGNIFYPDSAATGTTQVYYDYTDGNGCTGSDTITVTVNPLPVVTLANFQDICESQSQLILTGGSPSGGSYSGNAVNGGNGLFYPPVAGKGLHNIIYNFTDIHGCSNSATATIRVVGTPPAQFSLPGSSCKGDSVAVAYNGNVSSNAIFNWYFDGGTLLSGTGAGPLTVRWDTAGIKALTLSVTDSGCSSQTYSNYINVMDAIAMATAVSGNTACHGDSVLIFANNGPGYSFRWFDTTGLLTSPGDTSAYFNALQSGVYYVKVTNNYGCSAISNQITATVYPQLYSSFTMPATACKNDIVTVNLSGTPDSSSAYNWYFDGGTIASGSGAGPYGIIWNTDSIKTVKLTVTKWGCSSPETQKNINIITTPAKITALGPTTFCDGGSVTLYPNAGANLSYNWFKDGQSLNDTSAYYTATQAGNYQVKVTNTVLGCQSISDSVTITVNTTDFNLAFSANQTNFTLPPFIVNITNNTNDTNSYYWMWSMGDGSSYTVANPVHQYSYDGTYTVGVVAQNINTGCYDTLVKQNYISCQGGNANPCTLTAAITPGGPKSICPGDSILLTAAANQGATYQWLKDGVLIPGADTTEFWAKQTGNYQVMVSDTACSRFSLPFSLSLYNTITPVINSNGNIMPCTNDSMELYVTTSFNSYLWSNGMTTPSVYIKNSGNYTVTATDINGCQTVSAPFVINASLLNTPQICIVGVDSSTNSNFIVWERHANPLIDSFRIYRESSVAGVYNLIGSKGFNDPGYFLDAGSNPMQKAYRYKITAIDTCGMETPPSDYHKTIHLSINAGLNGSWNLIWSHYKGFNFGSYRIYRGYDSTAMQPLTQIQSTLNSYTDLNPPAGKVYYQIEVVSPHPCYPDSVFTKAKTNYNTSRSNHVNTTMAPNTGFIASKNNTITMMIIPNPNKGAFEVEITNNKTQSDNYKLEIINTMGKSVYTEHLHGYSSLRKSIHLETLSKGLYFIRLTTNDNILTTKFIIR